MGYNARLNPNGARTASFASVATNASSNIPVVSPTASGQVISARFVNGTTSSVASGTTAGSAVNCYVFKNASNAASIVASGRLGQVATYGTADLSISTDTALSRFVNGDVLLAEFVGGVGNNRNNAGCFIQVGFMYAQTHGQG